MTHYTTIEINEIETEVKIEFENRFGDIEISKITNVETGDAIDLELPSWIYDELHESFCDYEAESLAVAPFGGRYSK